jgi:predicted nucleic acid-binding Zn ribbon protein
MQKLKYFIFLLCIIFFSGLSIIKSLPKEGLDCSGACVKSNDGKNTNTFIVMMILIVIIVWIVMIQ